MSNKYRLCGKIYIFRFYSHRWGQRGQPVWLSFGGNLCGKRHWWGRRGGALGCCNHRASTAGVATGRRGYCNRLMVELQPKFMTGGGSSASTIAEDDVWSCIHERVHNDKGFSSCRRSCARSDVPGYRAPARRWDQIWASQPVRKVAYYLMMINFLKEI